MTDYTEPIVQFVSKYARRWDLPSSQVLQMENRLTEAQRWLARLRQVVTQRRTYPPGHPTVEKGVDELSGQLEELGSEYGPLRLFFEEHRVLSEEGYIFADARRDSLFAPLVADGVDALSLAPGIARAHLEGLVELLATPVEQLALPASVILWRFRSSQIRYRLKPDFEKRVIRMIARDAIDDPYATVYIRCLKTVGPSGFPTTRKFIARRSVEELVPLRVDPQLVLRNLTSPEYDWRALVLTDYERDQAQTLFKTDDPNLRLLEMLAENGEDR